MLAERPNEVLTRNELHEFVWREQGFEVDDSSLTQAISTLRKMLKDSTKSPEFVKTVPKRGYQLICSVERLSPLSSEAALTDVDAQEEENEAPVVDLEQFAEPTAETKAETAVEQAPTAQPLKSAPAQKQHKLVIQNHRVSCPATSCWRVNANQPCRITISSNW